VDDAVKLKQAPHTSRPRSANIVRLELADANLRPRQLSALYREVVCLVRCDSTDTTLARGKQFWVKQGSIEPRPFGAGRDFCTAQPKWSKEFGGACKLFDQIAEEQARTKLIDRKTPSPREAHFIRKPQRPVPLTPEARPSHRHRRRCPPSPRVRVAPSPRVGWREPPPMTFGIDGTTTSPTSIPPEAIGSVRNSSSRPSCAREPKSVSLPPPA